MSKRRDKGAGRKSARSQGDGGQHWGRGRKESSETEEQEENTVTAYGPQG